MNEILLMLHFIGLGLGASGTVAGFVVGRLVMASPKDAPVLGRVPQMVSRFSGTGLGLLWITGIIMVWSRWDGPASLPHFFWAKFVFVVAITIAFGFIEAALAQAKRGDPAGAQKKFQIVGPIASLCLLLIIVFAVLAFN
ncbi:MAG: hypothetical protein ABI399_12760 [Bauldia sp.]